MKNEMISFEKAYDIMMTAAKPLAFEQVDLSDSLQRVLGQDVVCDMDSPPFDKSAMDGFACRKKDLARELTMVEDIPAGHLPTKRIGTGECARIMTGAPVPEGADCVIIVEQTEQAGTNRVRFTGSDTAENICRRGEDAHACDVLLRRGDIITPAHIAVLASVGCTSPLVAKRPRIGVIATGSELVEPGEKPGKAQIRNSNSCQLCAQIHAMGTTSRYYGIAPDADEAINSMVKKAKSENDVVLVSGGVSVGVYDLVPEILRRNKFELLFESIAMQPGKPTVFGTDGLAYCCGMPGNPVATLVVFELMLKPFLYKLMGHDFNPLLIPAMLDGGFHRGKAQRQATIPVRFVSPGKVSAIEYHGSAHIHAMPGAEGLLTIPAGVTDVREGEIVHVRRI